MTEKLDTAQKQNDVTKIVACPTCKKSVKWDQDNIFRPFCCKRCKLIDLGEWASEGHKIAGEKSMFVDDDSSGEF
ncbi:MAG TPA: DNA gyrase inhibitor YacG [Aeromonadales bacterium]|nr:DNA gyrase inhibitor YacG [Aeromonadales bacterium]